VREQTEEELLRNPGTDRLIMLPVYVSVFWMFIFGSLYSSILSLFFAGTVRVPVFRAYDVRQ
jgi:hypothetical protein